MEEINAAIMVFIIMAMIAGSAYFWHSHGQFIERCLERGGTQEQCWNLMK